MKEIAYEGSTETAKEKDKLSEHNGKPVFPTLRTYRDDVAHLALDKDTTKIQIASAETRRREERKEHMLQEAETTSHLGWALFSVMLMFAFLLGVSLYLLLGKSNISSLFGTSAQSTNTPTPTQTTVSASINIASTSRAQIVADISIVYGKSVLGNGSAREILFTDQDGAEVSTQDFFRAIAPQAPKSLATSLQPDFTVGISASNMMDGYFIFHSRAYPKTFASMLEWEPVMPLELFDIVHPWTSGNHPPQSAFTDLRTEHGDTRALYNDRNQCVLIYGFPKRDILLVAGSVETFNTLAEKINSQ